MASQATVSGLPAAFVRQPASSALRFKNRRKIPLHRLPFADDVPGKICMSFWAVPKTGGYYGGNTTGAALARIYMKHLREHGSGLGAGSLQRVVLDMFDCEEGVGISAEHLALRGQVVGFFVELEYWLAEAAKYLGDRLDRDDNKMLIKEANEGLNFDYEAYIDSLSEEEGDE